MPAHFLKDLPFPSTEEQEQTACLTRLIFDEIDRHQGRISFQKYMQMALYYPRLGYYRSPSRKFGEGGDFVTAPELSPLFSWTVARQLEQVLRRVANPVILELGAGTGVMALEIMRELARQQCPLETYYILEVSGELRARQQALFSDEAPELLPKVVWLDRLPERALQGVIMANEVMDAMPVRKFEINAGIQEVCVRHTAEQLAFESASPEDVALIAAVQALELEFAEGYTSEINMLLTPWIKSLADSLQQGLILLIDYGYVRSEYYHPSRSMGTLMCHYKHRAHDNVLLYPGIQDITCHVDFTAVAIAADEAELHVAGFTHQAAFLVNCGLHAFYQQAIDTYAAAQQVKRLTLPSEMGERFKVIALTKDFDDELLGFSMIDQRARL